MKMNKTQFKVGDLVKCRYGETKGIVVEVPRTMRWVKIYWFNWGEVTRTRNHKAFMCNVILLSRGHNND